MSKKQPPLKSTKPPLGFLLAGGFLWGRMIRSTCTWSQKLYGEPAPKCTTPWCVQSETEPCRLWDTVFNVRPGEAKPHMQRDALPKAHPNKIMGKLKNSAKRATQGKPRQTVITRARREQRGSLCRSFLETSS